MRVLITGATGFIGKHLCQNLLDAGYEIIALTRDVEKAQEALGSRVQCARWNGKTTEGWQDLIEDAEAVINLAGENLAEGPWTERYRQRILESRVNAGKAVAEAISKAQKKPKALLQASGIGFYGSRGDEELTEASSAGSGFLAEVVKEWEASVKEVEKQPVRVIYLRTGIVLGRGEGMIGKMTLPFKLFGGGPVGGGRQWLSWIHITDEVGIIRFLLEQKSLSGAFNLAAPNPVQMAEFCREFARALNRHSWLPVPAFVIKTVFGQMGEETVLASQRVLAARIKEAGYHFQFSNIKPALENLLKQ